MERRTQASRTRISTQIPDGEIVGANQVPSVSVVIPFFNSSATLRRALESVVWQTVPPKEVIVVDDCSGEQESIAARRIISSIRGCRLARLPVNSGPGSARNAGWELATGQWIAFLDSDDAWHPRKLELQLAVAQATNDAVLIACDWMRASDLADLLVLPIPSEIDVRPISRPSLILRNQMVTPSVIVRRELPVRFTDGRRYSEDYELWMKVIGHGPAARLEYPLAGLFKASFGESGQSAALWRMIVGEYVAYISAMRAGALTPGEATLGLLASTARAGIRLCRVALRKARSVAAGRGKLGQIS